MKIFNFYKISLASVLLTTPLCIFPLKILAHTPTHQYPGIIINSGSTNACGYTIYVFRSGKAIYTVCNNQQHLGQIKVNTATKFLEDISKAEPLSSLPAVSCVKSVSFGTSTEIKYQGQQSPDVSCASDDSRVTNLYNDATSIQHELGFSTSKIR